MPWVEMGSIFASMVTNDIEKRHFTSFRLKAGVHSATPVRRVSGSRYGCRRDNKASSMVVVRKKRFEKKLALKFLENSSEQ